MTYNGTWNNKWQIYASQRLGCRKWFIGIEIKDFSFFCSFLFNTMYNMCFSICFRYKRHCMINWSTSYIDTLWRRKGETELLKTCRWNYSHPFSYTRKFIVHLIFIHARKYQCFNICGALMSFLLFVLLRF